MALSGILLHSKKSNFVSAVKDSNHWIPTYIVLLYPLEVKSLRGVKLVKKSRTLICNSITQIQTKFCDLCQVCQ